MDAQYGHTVEKKHQIDNPASVAQDTAVAVGSSEACSKAGFAQAWHEETQKKMAMFIAKWCAVDQRAPYTVAGKGFQRFMHEFFCGKMRVNFNPFGNSLGSAQC